MPDVTATFHKMPAGEQGVLLLVTMLGRQRTHALQLLPCLGLHSYAAIRPP